MEKCKFCALAKNCKYNACGDLVKKYLCESSNTFIPALPTRVTKRDTVEQRRGKETLAGLYCSYNPSKKLINVSDTVLARLYNQFVN